MNDKVVLITGATGKQGGAVAHALLGTALKLRALTRKPDSEPAKALAARGVEIVQGDLDDAESVKAALRGVWGTFAVQNTWEAGVEREEEQGKQFARLAREAQVSHFVYTSVGSAQHATGIPHFDNKFRVEEVVRSLGFPSHVILRPVFFMENVVSPWFLQGDKVMAGLKPDTRVQMVAVEDIGRVGAQAFVKAEQLKGREIDVAGDELGMAKATQLVAAALGKPLEFVSLPLDAVRQHSEDMALMLEWFEKVGYSADIPALDREFGRMTRFDEWVKKHVKG